MKIHQHFALHKPFGYVSQFVFNQSKRRNKKLLGELYDFVEGTMAIGRLDKNSEGLLLLTTDGRMSEQIRSNNFEKEYYVEVDGVITEDKLVQLSQGVGISIYGKPYQTKFCEVRELNQEDLNKLPIVLDKIKRHRTTRWLSITLREGKFRQVRKMTSVVGLATMRLVRVRIGTIHLGNLKAGEARELDLSSI